MKVDIKSPHCQYCEVRLDGETLKLCTAVDTEEGWADVVEFSEPVHLATGWTRMKVVKRLTGKVELFDRRTPGKPFEG